MGYDEHHPPAHTPGAISERGPATPWNHEDYEFPPSVGPVIYFILFIEFFSSHILCIHFTRACTDFGEKYKKNC